MIDSLGTYITRHVRAQASRIFVTVHPYLSFFITVWLMRAPSGHPRTKFTLETLSSTALTYDTVVFGVAVAAMALMIAIPSQEFLYFLSQSGRRGAYRDLAFVISWTGVVHWIALVLTLASIAFLDKDTALVFQDRDLLTSGMLFSLTWAQIYGLCQFLVNLLAIFEISDLYGLWLVAEARKRSKPRADDPPGAG